MPRVAGVNIIAVLAGAVALFFVGFVFYGLVFQQLWSQQLLENHGVVPPGGGTALTGPALMEALAKIPNAMPMGPSMGLGFLISLITALGLALMLKMTKAASLAAALRCALLLWLGFAASTLAYNVVYYSESRISYFIDLAHTLVAYLAASAVIFLIDGKAIKA